MLLWLKHHVPLWSWQLRQRMRIMSSEGLHAIWLGILLVTPWLSTRRLPHSSNFREAGKHWPPRRHCDQVFEGPKFQSNQGSEFQMPPVRWRYTNCLQV